MKKHYHFSKSKPNLYIHKANRQVTIRLDEVTIEYFKSLATSASISCQNLINRHLRDCAAERKKLKMEWAA